MTETAELLVDIVMPKLSDSMEEATVLAWLKKPGDHIECGESLLEVETDKATIVYDAEVCGVLAEIVVPAGGRAPLGGVIARLFQHGDATIAEAPPDTSDAADRPTATPVARRLAAQLGVSLLELAGTGPSGRITADDVRAAHGRTPTPITRVDVSSPVPDGQGRGEVRVVQLTATQQTIARRMTASGTTIPDFMVEMEVSMDAAIALRDQLRELRDAAPPSLNDLVIRATACALLDFPAFNAAYSDGASLQYSRINIGVAVATDDALVVPTVHDAGRRSVFEIAVETRRLIEAARAGTLTPKDLADGTFTISNLGMYGVRRFSPLINPPQVGILAVGCVNERPAVRDGALVAARAADFALACDHRVVHGAEAARFLSRLRDLLERAPLLLLENDRFLANA